MHSVLSRVWGLWHHTSRSNNYRKRDRNTRKQQHGSKFLTVAKLRAYIHFSCPERSLKVLTTGSLKRMRREKDNIWNNPQRSKREMKWCQEPASGGVPFLVTGEQQEGGSQCRQRAELLLFALLGWRLDHLLKEKGWNRRFEWRESWLQNSADCFQCTNIKLLALKRWKNKK